MVSNIDAGPAPVAIFGGRGGGAVVAFTVDRLRATTGLQCLGFLNDVEAAGATIAGHPVLGPFAAWRDLPPAVRFAAPLHKAKEMMHRAEIISGLGVPRDRWATLIDPQAALAHDSVCGAGLFVAPGAAVLGGSRLGEHVCIRGGAQVSHDCTIGDFVFVGANAVVCGYATLRHGAHIAPGAVVRDGATVGRYSVVGLGAVVVRDVPDGVIVAGNPAKLVGRVGEYPARTPAAE